MKNENTGLAPWEQAFDKVLSPFDEFIHHETTAGYLLMASTVVALILANSPLAHGYEAVLHTSLGFSLGPWRLEHSLHHWINDGLMWLFFFVVGLEIKREVLIGELSDIKQATLPIVAAIGGMVIPALMYSVINPDGDGARGWGVPMATDIAFAVGVLVLLGTRVPKSLLTFLVALAIVDDLGAVAVIALFYTDTIVWSALAVVGGLTVVLIVFNRVGIRQPLPYFLVGIVLWMAMLESGVHATVAGIITAWTIPARSLFDRDRFGELVVGMGERFQQHRANGEQCFIMDDEGQRRGVVQALLNGVHMVETPLQRLEHTLHLPVAFLVIPVFALANAGIPIELASLPDVLVDPIAIGILVGLVLGKLVGIAGVSLLAVKLGIGEMPAGTNARHLIGVGLIGGIGFTMSIFVAELGFAGQEEALVMAKTGVLFASLLAGLLGYLWLRFLTEPAENLS